MGKKGKKPTNSSIDLRRRSKITIEPAAINNLSKEELEIKIKAIACEVDALKASDNGLDFMLIGPRIKAISRMKEARRSKLAVIISKALP